MLQGHQLKKELGGRTVLDGVDLLVRPGRATILIGPNGAGKSVALRALAMIDAPDAGHVSVDGRRYDFPGATLPNPWPDITVCFQQLFLWPHLTLRRSAELVLKNRKLVSDRFEQLVESLRVQHLLDRYPNECSLGERQRAALFRALVIRPKYLLADEVTAAMDIEAAERVVEVLESEMKAGVGVLLVTHHLGLATRLAASIEFFEHGQVIESGTAEILAEPRTERLQRFVRLLEPIAYQSKPA